jgi:hypothetical protein
VEGQIKMGWREVWEDEAQAEYDVFCAMPLASLLERVARNELGSYYVIWNAIATKGDLRLAGWPLFEFASSTAPYLHRYHCAAALLTLLQTSRYQPAQLTVDHLNSAAALADVASMLEAKIGRVGRSPR